jgi:sulfate adenylyltransferase
MPSSPVVSLWADAAGAAALAASIETWPSHTLTPDQAAAAMRLLDGTYSPLTGFMTADDATSVARIGTLADGTPWPVPVTLDVAPATAERLARGEGLVLREAEGRAVAVMPAARAWKDGGGWHAGGRLLGLQAPPAYDLLDLRQTPAELRDEIGRRGWRAAVAVPVDGLLHRADVAALVRLAEAHDAGLVVLVTAPAAPPAGRELYARVRALRLALGHLPPGRTILVFDPRPAAEGLAGSPIDAVAARNRGCTRLVAWDAASAALDAAARAAGIAVDALPRGPASPAGDDAASRDAWTFPEVAAALARETPAPSARGVTLFFTGLSGSGKSTIANALRVRLLEDGRRTVTLLDGDLVRQHLSSELGFSREHRALNVRRIAFVAAEIARHGGLAICAPIAPYASVRAEARTLVEAAGAFLLVYVATPIEVCEARDPKGLYKRARAGTLAEFTGVSDPYEAPDDADVTIDAGRVPVAQAVDTLMGVLEARGFLSGSRSGPGEGRSGGA